MTKEKRNLYDYHAFQSENVSRNSKPDKLRLLTDTQINTRF